MVRATEALVWSEDCYPRRRAPESTPFAPLRPKEEHS